MIQLSVSWERLIRGMHLEDSTRSCPSQTCVSHLNFLKSSVETKLLDRGEFPLTKCWRATGFRLFAVGPKKA